jgi:NAD(P)-dependent dehydrogenase (short-subunit alcohol dehydrogenase family)
MRILITGAGRAIGRATAEHLTSLGHEVVATARNVELLEGLDVASKLSLDVTSEQSIVDCLEAAGSLDAIVNNAALPGHGPLENVPLDHVRAMFETNTFGPLRILQQVLPAWRTRGSGVVVNVSSIQGRVAVPLDGAYAASKFALEAFTETLHYEISHFGLRVVLIEPGYTAPGMKQIPAFEFDPVYDELVAQWDGADGKVTGEGGRPPASSVAEAIAAAIVDPTTPLRVPVGPDANLILPMRSQLDDQSFEATMRSVLGLTW